MWHILYFLLFFIFLISTINGKFDRNFILRNMGGRLPDENINSLIYCINSDLKPEKIKFGRVLDTGQGPRLPSFSGEYIQGKPVFARILVLNHFDTANFGVYHCQIVTGGISTTVTALKLPPLDKVEIDAEEPYISVNEGEDVELKMIENITHNLPIHWRQNGIEIPEWKNQLQIKIKNVSLTHHGIYECYYEGRRNESVHGLLKLTVRACPIGKYGNLCDRDCPPCYNGGVCHDIWGDCICPSGFSGTNCEIACGSNKFGKDCEIPCVTQDQQTGCAFHIFCKPDPYGCSCAPGYKGPKCGDECEPGMYGADCKQVCHCFNGPNVCNRITGGCEDNICAPGWTGDSCQIPNNNTNSTFSSAVESPCEAGRFGENCEKKCHCLGKVACDAISGVCPGECDSKWNGTSCNECIEGRFGENCESVCHCQEGNEYCDITDGSCSHGCEAGWTGFTCQQECSSGRFGSNCASSCHCLNGPSACDKISGKCDGGCEAGYMADDCQTFCPPHKFGINCLQSCKCYNGGLCSRFNGSCTCVGHWCGINCTDKMPQIIATSDGEVNTGQYSIISCTAEGIPIPSLEITSRDFNERKFEIKVRKFAKNQRQAIANITTTSSPGNFTFHCAANNTYSFDIKIISVLVIDPPVLHEGPEVLKSTSSAVTLSWKPWEYGQDYGGKESDRVDYLVVFHSLQIDNWDKIDNWIPMTTTTVNDLLPDTEYEFAVKCRRPGKLGEGRRSPGITVKTLCGVPTNNAMPLNFHPTEITSRSASLSWEPPIASELQCSLIGYVLRYHQSVEVHNRGYVNISEAEESYVLDGLMPHTDYVLNLFVVTSRGKGKQYAELTFSTPEEVPGPVHNLNYKLTMNPSLIIVTWDESSIKNGIIKDFLITYEFKRYQCEKLQSLSKSKQHKTVPATETKADLQDLLPYSVYEISVQASTSSGYGESKNISVLTSESTPSLSPQNVRNFEVDKSKLTFEWDPIPCEKTNGIIKFYEYILENDERKENKYPRNRRTISNKKPPPHLKQVSGTTVTVHGLTPYEEYAFKVRACTNMGDGPFSEKIYSRTADDVPPPPFPTMASISENILTVKWLPPHPPHGILIKYRIHFWPRDKQQEIRSVSINHNLNTNGVITYSFSDLEPYRLYSAQVQASTRIGWGNWSEVVSARTKEGVPEAPSSINMESRTNNSITIAWSPPIKHNGIIKEYKALCSPISSLTYNIKAVNPIEFILSNETLKMAFNNLQPNTEYSFSVSASTGVGFGPPVKAIYWTSFAGSLSPPTAEILEDKISNSTIPIRFLAGNSNIIKYQIIIEDARNTAGIDETLLTDHYTSVEENVPYYITAELNADELPKEDYHYFVVGDRKHYGGYPNVHLSPGVLYNIRIRTTSKEHNEIKSAISEARQQIIVGYQEDAEYEKSIFGLSWLQFILIVLGMIVILIVIVFVTAVSIYRYRQNKVKKNTCFTIHDPKVSDPMTWSIAYKVSESEAIDGPLVNDGQTFDINSTKGSIMKMKKIKKTSANDSLPVDYLPNYIYNKNTYSASSFSQEFEHLSHGQYSQWTVGKTNENTRKNRYGNILPYDHSRVILKPVPDVSSSDYINANYIDGYNKTKEYIATQGPKENTCLDFWRMVWQENSSVIVMLTGLVENGKQKCYKYWPDDSILYGDLQILLSHTEPCMDFIVRTVLIRKVSTGDTRRVRHYQYLDWPDHKIPPNASSLLVMLRRIRSENTNVNSPIIVHCSAGIGRSGTFIALDSLWQQAQTEQRVDIFGFINKMRMQRINMVQNLEQYIFIHEALLEAIQCGNTAVMADSLPVYIHDICSVKSDGQISELEYQFQALSKINKKVNVNECSDALSEENIFKNRDPMVVPTDQNRLKLITSTEDKSDYINAVAVDGYKHKDAFLVTQMPLNHTTVDFWKLIYDNNSSLIVMLNDSIMRDDQNIGQYWPTEGSAQYNEFEVQVVTCEDQGSIIVRIMKLFNVQDPREEPHRIIQLQYMDWAHSDTLPANSASMLTLLNQVDRWYRQTTGGPITIHCMNGTNRCGVFCAVNYVCEQLKTEHIVDVFSAIKKIRVNRPEFISSVEQYKFCYEVAMELVDSYSIYSNFRLSH